MLAIACIDGIVNNTILIKFIVSDFELNFKKFIGPGKRKLGFFFFFWTIKEEES